MRYAQGEAIFSGLSESFLHYFSTEVPFVVPVKYKHFVFVLLITS